MADEKARERAEREVAKQKERDFAAWVKIQEDAGYTVVARNAALPLSMGNAIVQEIEPGPEHDLRPGG